MRLTRILGAAAAGAAALAMLPASAASSGKSYQAPFKVGPSGGDNFSYHDASADGTVTVARVYPIPGAINCTKGAPYAKLQIPLKATKAVKKVVVSYDNAAVDNFTFAMVGLRDAKRWYGSTTLRGLVSGSGTIMLKPDDGQGPFPHRLIVEFGLQQSSACPNADAGTIQFTKVEVFS